jgi:Zn-dependent peptidase ImmA (M78 family)/DNA-binding XRE family transcriptional regulator
MIASAAEIGQNIQRARLTAGITQDRAAELAGLSRAAYRSLECGASEPRTRTLLALAAALDVRPEDLIRVPDPLPRARFRSLKRLNNRTQILMQVGRQLRDYRDLEEVLGIRSDWRLGRLADELAGLPPRPIEAARRAREALGLGEDDPVRDIAGLLEERAGVKLIRANAHTDAFFGLSVAAGDGGPAIVVNTWDRISVERWIFTAAHELGHLLLHLGDFDADRDTEETESEREANVFAGHFLMPDKAFRREWRQAAGLSVYERVVKVKRIFHVSYKTVLYRLQEDLGVPDVWVRFQMDAKRQTGKTLAKTDEPEALRADAFGWGNPEWSKAREPQGLATDDFVPDRRFALIRQAVEGGEITLARAAEILGLPLATMKTLRASWL